MFPLIIATPCKEHSVFRKWSVSIQFSPVLKWLKPCWIMTDFWSMTCAAVRGRVEISLTISCFHRWMLRNNGDGRRRYHGKTCRISRRTSPVSPALQTRQGEEGRGDQLFTKSSLTPGAVFGIWIWEHAEVESAGQTSACVLPWTDTWSRYCCLRVSIHFCFLAPSGCEWPPWVVAAGFVEPFEPVSNLHLTSKGMGLRPHRLLRPMWNELCIDQFCCN